MAFDAHYRCDLPLSPQKACHVIFSQGNKISPRPEGEGENATLDLCYCPPHPAFGHLLP